MNKINYYKSLCKKWEIGINKIFKSKNFNFDWEFIDKSEVDEKYGCADVKGFMEFYNFPLTDDEMWDVNHEIYDINKHIFLHEEVYHVLNADVGSQCVETGKVFLSFRRSSEYTNETFPLYSIQTRERLDEVLSEINEVADVIKKAVDNHKPETLVESFLKETRV